MAGVRARSRQQQQQQQQQHAHVRGRLLGAGGRAARVGVAAPAPRRVVAHSGPARGGGGASPDEPAGPRRLQAAADKAGRELLERLAVGCAAALLALSPADGEALATYAPGLTPEERQTVGIFESNTPSVVYITNLTVRRRDVFTLDAIEAPQGAGSGFVWDREGHIVTNFHVIRGANDLRVTLGDQALERDSGLRAEVVGFDENKDIAVLKLQDVDPARLRPLNIGTSTGLVVGQKVYAIGNPFGLDHTLTTGVISGLGREIQSGVTGRPIDGVLQTDAAINPGNSGGPLLNSQGQFIGINTAIYSASGTSSGVGFALPADMVAGVVDQIIRLGHVTRPVIGITFAPDAAVDQLGLGGVLVLDARAGGPAAQAGILPTTRDADGRLVLGDVITAINGTRVTDSGDLYRILDKCNVGDTIAMDLSRGGRKESVELTLQDMDSIPPTMALPMFGQQVLPDAMPFPQIPGGDDGGGAPPLDFGP